MSVNTTFRSGTRLALACCDPSRARGPPELRWRPWTTVMWSFSFLPTASWRTPMGLLTERTTFSQDVLGRYTLNTWQEAMDSVTPVDRLDGRPFDLVIVGGGSFGGALAHHLFMNDTSHAHRILVLEAGPFVLPEHFQNLPLPGFGPAGPTETDPHVLRNEVWGLPWRSPVAGGFTGLAYCLGGRSVFFGGWAPELLEAETLA